MTLEGVAHDKCFYGREQEIKRLLWLISNENIIFYGSSRLGKSTLLNQFCSVLAKDGMVPINLDVGSCSSILGILREIDKATSKSTNKKPKMHLKGLKDVMTNTSDMATVWKTGGSRGNKAIEQLRRTKSTELWRAIADSLQEDLGPAPLVIILDEFSMFLDKTIKTDLEETINFLDYLRSWRQSKRVKCRFIFTGSTSLPSIINNSGLHKSFSDCYYQKLTPLSMADAQLLLAKEANRSNWHIDDKVSEYLCHRVKWLSPHFLNLLLDEAIMSGDKRLKTFREPLNKYPYFA